VTVPRERMTGMGPLPPGQKIVTYADLALALGASGDSFTGQLAPADRQG